MRTGIVNSRNIRDVKKLWSYCFADTPEFKDYYFANRYRQEKNLITTDDIGKVQASLQLSPYVLKVDGVSKDVNYVVGVCVQPESRGKGYSTAIMKDTLNYQYRNDEDVSILMPIDTEIYTRYGYTNCFYRYDFSVDLINIRAGKTCCEVRRAELEELVSDASDKKAPDEDILVIAAQMSEFYHSNIVDKYSYIKRDRQYFINRLEELSVDGGELFLSYDEGVLSGYMMLLPKYSQGHAMVPEMMFRDKDAFNSLMSIIKSHITQFRTADIVTPQHELFNLFIKYDNKYKVSKKSFMMVRIINARNILCEILRRNPGIRQIGAFKIEIEDSVIEDNNFTENFDFSDEASAEAEKSRGGIPFIRLDISDLASLYMKSSNIDHLERAGRIKFESEHDRSFFSDLFGNEIRESYINDYI